MEHKNIILTRDELYLEVWSTPIKTLAKKYGISDVGLAKKCRKHLIPLPGRGFWAKKSNGKALPKKPLLKKLNINQQHLEIIRFNNQTDSSLNSESNKTDEISHFEKLKENLIKVEFRTELKHPLALKTAKSLRRTKSNEKKLHIPKAKKCLNVIVSETSIERAMNIMDALVISLESRGYAFVEGTGRNDGSLLVDIDGIALSITLEEYIRRIEHVLTPKEEKRVEKDRWYRYKLPQHDYIPTGKLTLRINGAWQYRGQKSWSDAKIQRVENCLNDFVIALKKCSSIIKAKKEEDELRERQLEELRQKKEIFLQEKRDEEEKLNRLHILDDREH